METAQIESLIDQMFDEAGEDNPLTTHILAKYLLQLPDMEFKHDDHTETWTDSPIDGIQFGYRTY